MTERNGSLIGKTSADFLMNRVSEQVEDPNKNLDVVKRRLKTGSAILIFNHFKGDFFVWAKFIQDNITTLDNATALVAQKYLDPKRGAASKILGFMFPQWEMSHGVTVLPAVQEKDKHLYPNHARINLQTTLKAREILKKPGTIVAYSPEGTRSANGELGEAEEGADFILRTNKNSLVIPVAAVNLSETKPKLYGSNTKIIVGTPFFYSDIQNDKKNNPEAQIKDLIMLRIATLLPEQNRGFYK